MARSVQVPDGFAATVAKPREAERTAHQYDEALQDAWSHRGTDSRARVVARIAVRRLRQLRTLREEGS